MARSGLFAPVLAPLASALLAVLAAGCNSGGSSGGPTAPPGDAGVAIVFTDGGPSAPQQAIVIELIEQAFNTAGGRIPITGTTAEVGTGQSRIIPGWQLGGFALSPTRIEIAVDPAITEATLRARLPPLAAHEFHHAARFRGPGYGNTLLQAIVSEGLADRFAVELYGQPLPPWVVALPPADIPTWLATAEPEFDSTTFDFNAWFFGTGGAIPRWTGYTLGWTIVGDYLAANPGTSASSLVHADAELFRP